MTSIVPIILCGGSGQRLWPLSSLETPKQFAQFKDGKSLIEFTVERVKLITNESPIFVTSKNYEHLINIVTEKLGLSKHIIYEDISKNTTASIFFACQYALQHFGNSYLLILPSDHYITKPSLFKKTIIDSKQFVKDFNWIVYGIKPTAPSAEYGYILTSKINRTKFYNVEKFIEKPSLEKAKKLIKKNDMFWNSGIFFGSTKKIIKSIKDQTNKKFEKLFESWDKRRISDDGVYISKKQMSKICTSSIDYDVMEKENKTGLFCLNVGWSDIGTWDSFSDNIIEPKSKTVIKNNCKNTYVFSPNRNTVLLGVDNIIVVNSNNSTLVTTRDQSSKLKEVLNKTNHIKDKKQITDQIKSNSSLMVSSFKKISIHKSKTIKSQKRIKMFLVLSGKIKVSINSNLETFIEGDIFKNNINKPIKIENISKNYSELIELNTNV